MDSGASRAIPLTDEGELLAESALHAAIPQGLFELTELDVMYEEP